MENTHTAVQLHLNTYVISEYMATFRPMLFVINKMYDTFCINISEQT